MRILIDMNLSPDWVQIFQKGGYHAVHWSTIGSSKAADEEIMRWALQNDYIVFTHDLDFGAILAATQAAAPSVIQARTQDILPEAIGKIVLRLISEYEEPIRQGALITFDLIKARVRILPIH